MAELLVGHQPDSAPGVTRRDLRRVSLSQLRLAPAVEISSAQHSGRTARPRTCRLGARRPSAPPTSGAHASGAVAGRRATGGRYWIVPRGTRGRRQRGVRRALPVQRYVTVASRPCFGPALDTAADRPMGRDRGRCRGTGGRPHIIRAPGRRAGCERRSPCSSTWNTRPAERRYARGLRVQEARCAVPYSRPPLSSGCWAGTWGRGCH